MTCCKENVDTIMGNDVTNSLLDTSGKRKKKFTGGNASKRHRDRVNIEFSNLAKLLPFSESVIAKLDKSSILRLAVSFIRAKSFFKDAERAFDKRINGTKNVIKKEVSSPAPERHIKEGTGVLSEIFSQALDGFLLVLTEDMKVLFVSESVREYLGYCQAGIIHENFLQFVNPSDHQVIQSCLMYRKSELENNKSYNVHQPGYHDRHMCNKDHLPNCAENDYNRNIARRQFVCRMKCAFSCSSRFYTAYRTFGFSGHLRRSTIQEGREQKHLNSLLLFAVPIPHTSSTSVETNSEVMDRSASHKSTGGPVDNSDFSSYYDRFGSGFRIEPTLRPHIAPIPVSRSDPAERHSPNAIPRVRSCSFVDIPPLDMRQREYIYISHDSQPCITKSYMSHDSQPCITKSFSAPCSIESRYSDYSDDSKCSPASSPNLLWKNRPRSPYVPQRYNICELTDQYRLKDALSRDREKCVRKSISEKEYCAIKLRASPDTYDSELNHPVMKYETETYPDIYPVPNLFTNHENTRHVTDVIPYRTMERIERKRNSMNSKDVEHVNNSMPVKRNKNQNIAAKRCSFNITSLLGLDQKDSNVNKEYSNVNKEYSNVNKEYSNVNKEYSNVNKEYRAGNRDEEVDVCKIEEDEEQKSYREILESIPRKLDLSYTRGISSPITPKS